MTDYPHDIAALVCAAPTLLSLVLACKADSAIPRDIRELTEDTLHELRSLYL